MNKKMKPFTLIRCTDFNTTMALNLSHSIYLRDFLNVHNKIKIIYECIEINF